MNGAGIHTALPPAQAQQAVLTELAAIGAQVHHQRPGTLTGTWTLQRRPSVPVAILLFLLCVVPGVIYLIAASKDRTEPFHITLTPNGQGTTIHVAGSRAAHVAAQRINYTREGWHPDPSGRHELRWHNGTDWTTQVANNGIATND